MALDSFARTAPAPDASPIVADADYYWTKARQCFRQARRMQDDSVAEKLMLDGAEFEARARSLFNEE